MPIICIPAPLRHYTDGQPEVAVQGETVAVAMEDLMNIFPAFRPQLYKQDGSLRSFVNLFLEGRNIRDLQGLSTPVAPGTTIQLVPSIAGG
jgi:molybdopterin synthase sulfur carrier subunit